MMRIHLSKDEEIRRILQDPLYRDQSLSAIARFVGVQPRTVVKQYRQLLADGRVAPRPPDSGTLRAAEARQREPEIVAMLLDPAWQARPLGAIAAALGLSPFSVQRRYRQLLEEGLVPRRGVRRA